MPLPIMTSNSWEVTLPSVRYSVAIQDEPSCPCISEDPILKTIKSIWSTYVPGREAVFPPSTYQGQQCSLKSFSKSHLEAIIMQCETLKGIHVVPDCLSYSLGPQHFYIISPHIMLESTDSLAPALDSKSSRIFYNSLSSAMNEIHYRRISLQNIALIKEYDLSNNFAVITDFSQPQILTPSQLEADWEQFRKRLPTEYLIDLKSQGNKKVTNILNNPELEVPSFQIEDYTCNEKLGAGTYGTVYGCTDMNGQEFAIKTFAEAGDESYISELIFLNEMKGVPYVIQKYHDNSSLKGKIKSIIVLEKAKRDMHSLNLWQARKDDKDETMKKYFAQIATAIHGIHLIGIIHEDIKPGNILVMEGGKIAVTDFGLSEKGKFFYSRWKCNIGFQPYFHPRLFGSRYFGSYVDWWAFGVILHQFFCHPESPTNFNYFDYNNLIRCRARNLLPLPDGISDLFKLIFSSDTYTSKPVLGVEKEELEKSVEEIEIKIRCQVAKTKYFGLEKLTDMVTWKSWNLNCLTSQVGFRYLNLFTLCLNFFRPDDNMTTNHPIRSRRPLFFFDTMVIRLILHSLYAFAHFRPGIISIALSTLLFTQLKAFPSLKRPLEMSSNPLDQFGPRARMPNIRRKGTPYMMFSAAISEEPSCPFMPEDPILKEIKATWVGYTASTEAFFTEPAMFRGQKCTLKSFKPSGEVAIIMQCETLEGIDVVPECLSYSLGPHHFYIISPHINLEEINAPDFAPEFKLREIFYYSLASAILEMHKRQVSLQNIELITQYDTSTYLAVIKNFSMHAIFNAEHLAADWKDFCRILPQDIKKTITPEQYINNVKSKLYDFILGDFTCDTKLGKGSYGVVYGCKDKDGQVFAIKTYSEGGDHTYVDELYFLEQLIGVPFVIQKKQDATSLTGKIKSIIVLEKAEYDMHSLDLWRDRKDDKYETMKKYFAQIALAIHGIHLKGIIHEDIKPGNILVMEGGKIAITDFGLSEEEKVSMSRWTCDEKFQIYYHPRLFGKSYFGSYVDWWAFGVILHQFFCLSVPPTKANYFDYENLVICAPRHSLTLPDGISDLFKLIFSRSTYSSQPVFESPPNVVEEAVEAIGLEIGCQIVSTKYFDLESEPTWEDWKYECAGVAKV